MDYIDKYADKCVSLLEAQIATVYAQAAREVREKLHSFISGFKARSKKMLQQVEDGTITKAQYKQWLRGQVFQGEQWRKKLEDVTRTYVNADQKARAIIGKQDKTVFSEAANYMAYNIEKVVGGVSFDLYDTKSVNRLIADNPKMLPEWRIDEKKDYIWNEKRVQNAISQGIIQGEAITDIGKRLYRDLSASNAGKMNMFARTAVTGAQNAGRVERMEEAEEMGIEVKKRWLSVHDDRVRDTHAELDGKEVAPDEDFIVDGKHIRYPGDPTAPPELVYNCRCTLTYVYPKYQRNRKPEDKPSYSEWKKKKSST